MNHDWCRFSLALCVSIFSTRFVKLNYLLTNLTDILSHFVITSHFVKNPSQVVKTVAFCNKTVAVLNKKPNAFFNKLLSHFVMKHHNESNILLPSVMFMLCWISLNPSPLRRGCTKDPLPKPSLQGFLGFLLETFLTDSSLKSEIINLFWLYDICRLYWKSIISPQSTYRFKQGIIYPWWMLHRT